MQANHKHTHKVTDSTTENAHMVNWESKYMANMSASRPHRPNAHKFKIENEIEIECRLKTIKIMQRYAINWIFYSPSVFVICNIYASQYAGATERERARESERDTTSLQLALWNELNRAALDVQMFSLLYFASVCFVSVFVFGFRFSWCGLPIYNIGMLFHATRFGCYRTKPSERCIWCAVSLFLFSRHTLQCVRASLYGTVIARFIFQIHTQHPVSVARL